ncbi:MAG: flavin reductase family protein, partial [Flavobacteriaceae bacterium]|nr:YjbH domain-containing protein [Muriicola sp.]NNL40829.1 flavin reductase family protein [Flavobacteriaceae bacterium]
VVRLHIKKNILDTDGGIDQHKIDQVARMGGNWYTRANMGMFEVPKPIRSKGMGVDKLPDHIRNSTVLSGNDLGMLGNVEAMPTKEEIEAFIEENPGIRDLNKQNKGELIHKKAKEYLMKNEVSSAWKVLMLTQ